MRNTDTTLDGLINDLVAIGADDYAEVLGGDWIDAESDDVTSYDGQLPDLVGAFGRLAVAINKLLIK